MIMPANYSAIAENELCYVDGGWLDLVNVKTLETNIATAIGNLYATRVMNAFIGSWFTGADGDKNIFSYAGDSIKELWTWNMDSSSNSDLGKVLRGFINTIGVLGGIWLLGTSSVYKPAELKGGTFGPGSEAVAVTLPLTNK